MARLVWPLVEAVCTTTHANQLVAAKRQRRAPLYLLAKVTQTLRNAQSVHPRTLHNLFARRLHPQLMPARHTATTVAKATQRAVKTKRTTS